MGSGNSCGVHELSEANHQILSYCEYMSEVAFEGLAGGSDTPSVVTNHNHQVVFTNVFPRVELQGFLCLSDQSEKIRHLISALAMT